MTKKVSYQNLLKQAIAEYDTSKNVEVKGPMLDPILSYDGGGELPTYKDAASILERYYFNEDRDEGIELMDEADYENDKGEKGAGSKDAEGTGTQQAGTSDKATIPADMKEIGKDLAKEQDESDAEEAEEEEAEEVEENEWSGKDLPKAKKYVDEQEEDKGEKDEKEKEDEPEEVTEDIENQVIEKLIAEMEDESDEEEDEDEEEVEEMKMTYTGNEPAVSNPKEKKASGPEEDAQGAGTQQAGTGPANGQVPPRKDVADKMVKPKNYSEQDEPPAPEGDEGGDDEEEDLDVDKKMKEGAPPPQRGAFEGQKDGDSDSDAVSEAFELFKEQIEDED